MATSKLTQTIARPVPEVFSAVVDLTTFPDWNPTTRAARRLSDVPIGEGTRYELTIKGFGKQELTLREFHQDRRVRLVPTSRMFDGGHLFVFSDQGGTTKVEHELVMNARHIFKVFSPLMARVSRKNLQETADALERHLEVGEN